MGSFSDSANSCRAQTGLQGQASPVREASQSLHGEDGRRATRQWLGGFHWNAWRRGHSEGGDRQSVAAHANILSRSSRGGRVSLRRVARAERFVERIL